MKEQAKNQKNFYKNIYAFQKYSNLCTESEATLQQNTIKSMQTITKAGIQQHKTLNEKLYNKKHAQHST